MPTHSGFLLLGFNNTGALRIEFGVMVSRQVRYQLSSLPSLVSALWLSLLWPNIPTSTKV